MSSFGLMNSFTYARKSLISFISMSATPITAAHRIDEISVFGFHAGSSQIRLTPAERKATDAKKQAGSRKGKQVVANTKAAKSARKNRANS